MKTRLLILFVLLLTLGLALAGAAFAQAPTPPTRSGYVPPDPVAAPDWDDAGPAAHARPSTSELRASTASAPAVELGQPGLNFRYVRTFGETEVAYLADTAHVNFPYGIATDGANVWIGELFGHRAMKFTSTGAFVSAIGTAGSVTGPFWEVGDLAVDSNGDTWILSGDQVIKFDVASNEVSRLWRDDDPNTHFSRVAGIAFDNAGNIYVSDGTPWHSVDEGNHRIQVFDPAGNYLATIGTSGTTGVGNLQFHGPHHIAIYNNTLYVADGGNHRVQVINVANPLAPVYVGTIGTTGESGEDNTHFSNPSGVAVDANYVYVADRWNNRIQIFNRGTRSYVATLGSYGSGNNQFWEPTDVAVDTLGNLYVADFVNTRVQQFDQYRSYVRTYGVARVPYLTDDYHYNNPTGVAAAPDGSLYIVEDNGHRLVKLNAAGQPQWTVGVPGLKGDWDGGNDKLNNPGDVALDAAGRVYVADQWHGRIQIFNPDGSYYATLDNGGTTENQVGCPTGVALAPNGYLYVTDPCSQRVQIFDHNLLYLASMGTSGEAGSDNAHFNEPQDVAVDSRGVIYVSDRNNHRVQVFNASQAYVRTIGEAGVEGNDFGHLSGPNGLTVDTADRLYIADAWNNRVQVFDKDGAYLTTIAGSWGTRTGQTRSAEGVAVASNGDMFVADWGNHRVQKFAPGVPGWRQVNINGFGDLANSDVTTLTPFAGQLYAGTGWNSGGAQLWHLDTSGAWTAATMNGFGDTTNQAIYDLVQFDGRLYAGTYNWDGATQKTLGAQVWRSVDGTGWEQVASGGFGDATNGAAFRMAAFGNRIYTVTDSFTNTHSSEIWRSASGDTGSWGRVVENAFGDADNWISAFEASATHLYAGTWNDADGAQVWRSSDGGSWAQVNANGFDGTNTGVISFAEFHGQLYAGTRNWTTGAQIWRCTTCDAPGSWSQVMGNGFGDGNNGHVRDLYVQADQLYATTYNEATGLEVWRTSDGVNWTEVGSAGLGDSNNRGTHFDRVIADFDGRLFVGTQNYPNGAELWVKTLTANFTATPTRGAPPLTVQFTNASSGDFTTSQWDFGDGETSTVISPTHTYAAAGTYTVTLTVGDGADTSTVTKPAFIVAKHFTYLPLVMRNYDPLLYDNFDDPAWDGTWNPAKWTPDQTSTSYRQQGGALVVTEPPSANPIGGTLRAVSPQFRFWKRTQIIEARLKTSSDRAGGWSPIAITLIDDAVNGHNWFATCHLGASGGASQAWLGCSIFIRQGDNYPQEYATDGFPVDYNTWCTARIETDPTTGNVKFYLNNALIGSHLPNDAAALVSSDQMTVAITNWGGDPNSSATRYVDDVRITPAR